MLRYMMLFVLCCALLFTLNGLLQAANIPKGTPIITVKTAMPAPDWALKERELLSINARIAERFAADYVRADGTLNLTYEQGGGTQAPDDMFECIYKLPMLYALGADDITWKTWWNVWRGSIPQLTQQGVFVNEMEKYLDWHHNGEQYEGFWLAGLCAPNDPEYRREALKFASFYDGTNPAVPNYDPEHKVIRSVLSGGAGPIMKATREQWEARGAKFWDAWLECGHDGPINLVTTCFGVNAFMLTGEEHYRTSTLEYIDAWRDRTNKNNGIIPSIVNVDGTVPANWWGGVMGWDFLPFGGAFQVTSGPRAAWGNALLLTGDTSYYDNMRTLADDMWQHRILDGNGNVDSVPRYYGKDGWYGSLNQPAANGIYASILANTYLATMKQEDLQRIIDRPLAGMAGHAVYHEGGYEPEWINYLIGKNPEWPVTALQRCINDTSNDLRILEADTGGPDRHRGNIPQVGWYGPLVNLMTGGIAPLWHGQLHLARFRYFDPERQRPGIPTDCAALVESMTADSADLVLVNLSTKTAHTILVQTGAYAEHQCLSVTATGGKPVKVSKGSLFAVTLAPGAGQHFTVAMKRYANVPTLRLPW